MLKVANQIVPLLYDTAGLVKDRAALNEKIQQQGP